MANEGDEAVPFCRAVLEQCSSFRRVTFFAVFDRVTKDSSLDLMRELERNEPRLRVIWAPEDRCVVDAYLRGYKEALDAGCDWILEIDAGFSHQPEIFHSFSMPWNEGMDCVFGSRFIGHFERSSIKRRIISWGGTKLANLLLGTRQTDMTSGFELFSRETLNMVIGRGIQSRAHFFKPRSRLIAES
jgi:dolichol-phosphate mannosyltransferase